MSEKEKVSSLITYLYETMNEELALDYANLDSKNIEILLDYIEKLENIIKEVREFIYKCNDGKQGINYSGCSKLLQILDKKEVNK